MPELPEVEVVRLSLEAYLTGKRIQKIEILNKKSFIGDPRLVEGQKIIKFSRIGKQLSIYLSNGYILLVHLKMTGQFIYGDTLMGHPTKDAFKQLPNKSTRIIFYFSPPSSKRGTKGEILYFNDQRKFGFVAILNQQALAKDKFLLNLGPEPWDMAKDEFWRRLQQHKNSSIKATILDQHVIAGVGNIYADEGCFLAGIFPGRKVSTITRQESDALLEGIREVMQKSIDSGGSTMKDYVRADGTKGSYLEKFAQVFRREGEPCRKCGTTIQKTRVAGRGTHYCPVCQPESK